MPYYDDDYEESPMDSPILYVLGIAIGIIVLVTIVTVGPGIGVQVENAAPAVGVNSEWNVTCRTALGLSTIPTGPGFFTTNIGYVVMLVVMIIVGFGIMFLISTSRRRREF